MANYNVTGAGGTTGHPANGRTPYWVENTIDVAQINGDSGAAQNDILRCIDVPANTMVLHASMEILTAFSNSVTLDLGMTQVTGNPATDVDNFVDGDAKAVGYSVMTTTARPVFAVAGTIDITVLDAAAAAGKVRVFAILCDVSTLDANTDRNTAAQHDTAV
tara:strand:- start:445 stop:930 length:486 start_codon:yes stop_codon:yes gene_type:complete